MSRGRMSHHPAQARIQAKVGVDVARAVAASAATAATPIPAAPNKEPAWHLE